MSNVMTHGVVLVCFALTACPCGVASAGSAHVPSIAIPTDAAEVTGEKLNAILEILRIQESALENATISYSLEQRPSRLLFTNAGGDPCEPLLVARHVVRAVLSGGKRWEYERRFDSDGRLQLTEEYAWNGTRGQRIIRNPRRQKTFGRRHYNPENRRSNPSGTDNLFVLVGAWALNERRMSEFLENHAGDIREDTQTGDLYVAHRARADTTYEAVLSRRHGYWARHVVTASGPARGEYRITRLGSLDTRKGKVFYPQSLSITTYGDPNDPENANAVAPGRIVRLVDEVITVDSIDFAQEHAESRFGLVFPEETVFK